MKKKKNYLGQPSTTGPASNNCDRSHVSRYTKQARGGLHARWNHSQVCPTSPSPSSSCVVNNKKKKNSFYGFTSQQPRYAFVKVERKLEPYVNLNRRHLVAITAMQWMIETHTELHSWKTEHSLQQWVYSNKKHLWDLGASFEIDWLTVLLRTCEAVITSQNL